MEFIIGALILLLFLQQLHWAKTTQKLIDKLMSRDYGSYVHATQPPVKREAINVVEEPAEDLGTLSTFDLR